MASDKSYALDPWWFEENGIEIATHTNDAEETDAEETEKAKRKAERMKIRDANYKPLPGKELHEPWMNWIVKWSQLIINRASPPTYEELKEEHEKIWESEWQIQHELHNSIQYYDSMRSVKRNQPSLKEDAEWLIKTIDDHRELRKVALMYRRWVDERIGPMDKAQERLEATIPWDEHFWSIFMHASTS